MIISDGFISFEIIQGDIPTVSWDITWDMSETIVRSDGLVKMTIHGGQHTASRFTTIGGLFVLVSINNLNNLTVSISGLCMRLPKDQSL